MKHTSLFCAVAIAAAMSIPAFATVTTNQIASITFEGESYPIGSPDGLTGWTVPVAAGDASEIIYAPLSEQAAVEGYTANKHLKLNTEGTELTWVPGTVSEPKALIEMKVRLVSTETAPAISDNDVHAAVCLVVSDTDDHTADGLYAFTATGWQKLDTSAFNADLVTGSVVALRVLMDYEAQTATYEGALLEDAENDTAVYYPLGTKDMANAQHAQTQGSLASIGFKGTGGVDDLFVSEIEVTASTASVVFEYWLDFDDPGAEETLPSQSIDTIAPNSAVTASFDADLAGQPLIFKLYDITDGPAVECSWASVPTPAANGDTDVTMANFAFQIGHAYLVKVTIGEEEEPLAAFSIGDAVSQAALATLGVAPVATASDENGDYFIVNVIEPAGATASLLGSATLDGSFADVNATRTVKTGYTELKYTIPANEAAKFFKVKFTK